MAIVLKKKTRPVRTSLSGGKKSQSNLLPQYNAKQPPCSVACPSAEDIRGYLTLIAQAESYGRSHEQATEMAWRTLTEKNPIPAIMGRICPHPCETGCNRNDKDEAVNINRVEMSIGDFGIEKGLALDKMVEEPSGKSVAVVGSGPAGISAAYQLARRGHAVTVYESKAEAGGMLRYGIPEYRLSREVIKAEYQKIWDLGVDFKPNTKIGKDIALDQLEKDFDAVFCGIGAQNGRELPMEGMDASNALTGADFLLQHNLGTQPEMPNKVLVIGGGDVAFDVARTCVRLGAKNVTLICRESKELMPAMDEEYEWGVQEGIEVLTAFTPKNIINEGGKITGIEFKGVELGEKDENGWPTVTEIDGTEKTIETEFVITAISQAPDFEGLESLKDDRGWITAEANGKVKDGLWAGGDISRRLGLVTEAVGDGRIAAEEIHYQLLGIEQPTETKLPVIKTDIMHLDHYASLDRQNLSELDAATRTGNFGEIVVPFDQEALVKEAERCMSCGSCFDCDNCWSFCGDSAVEKLPKGEHYRFKLEKCIGCNKCAEECPCGMIDMV